MYFVGDRVERKISYQARFRNNRLTWNSTPTNSGKWSTSTSEGQYGISYCYRSIQHPNLVSTVSCFLKPGHTGLVVAVWFSQVLNIGSFANYWNEPLFRVLQKFWGEASKKIMLFKSPTGSLVQFPSNSSFLPSETKDTFTSYILYASVLDGNVVEWQYENSCLV